MEGSVRRIEGKREKKRERVGKMKWMRMRGAGYK